MEDKLVLFLMGNGDVPATDTQAMYELAWSNGIRPVNERALKPGYPAISMGRTHWTAGMGA